MKSDIQIAQEAKMEPIVKIAEKLNLGEDDIELYGKYKCKISLDVLNKNKDIIIRNEKIPIIFLLKLKINFSFEINFLKMYNYTII